MSKTDSSFIAHPSSLLVIRLSAFGDVIHTIPAVVALRDALPQTEMAWAVEPAYAELVEIVARVKAIRVPLKQWSLARIAQARRDVRGFDAVIDFQGLIKSALIARASGAKLRYGFARDVIREKPAAWFVNRSVSIDSSRHVVEWNISLARACAPAIAHVPEVDFAPFADDAAGKLGAFENRIVLLPGAGRPEKQWPVERFGELARRIGSRRPRRLGPGEEPLARAIGAELAPPTSFRELAFLLRRARLLSAETPVRCISPRRSALPWSACTARPIPPETGHTASSTTSSSPSRRRRACSRSRLTTF